MKLLVPLVAASVASAHTIFTHLIAGGTNYGQGNGVRIPSYNGPIEDVSSNSLACNGAPNPTSPTSTIINVKAGDEVTAVWRYMLSTTGSAPNDIMDITHKGPTLAYLKKVTNAASDSGVGAGWFKIQEDGFNNGVWGTEKVINGQGIHKIKIPDCIEPGQYLLRAEMIALHGAGNYPGAQFYMECAQINVTGGGSAKPSTVSLPGAYSGTDPGIKLSIYYPPVTNYIIPGPRPFTCSANGGGSNPQPQPTTAVPPPATTSTTPPPSGPAAGQWQQCGGISWTGATTCVAPYTCSKINDHYFQCV